MKRLLIFLLLSVAGLQTAWSYYQYKEAFTIHPNGRAVKCYMRGADGECKDVLYKIYPNMEESNVGRVVHYVSCNQDKFIGIIVNDDIVYVKKGSVAVNTRNYSGEILNLYSEPDTTSEIVFQTDKVQTLPIYDINGHWLYVKLKDMNGRVVFGWLEPDMQCGSPFTSCP